MKTRRSSCAVVAFALAVAIAAASLLLLRAPRAVVPPGIPEVAVSHTEAQVPIVEREPEASDRLAVPATPTPLPPEPERAARSGVILTGRVARADGGPLGGTHARVYAAPASGRDIEAILREGSYSFGPLEPGEWFIRCAVPGYRGESRTIELRAGEPEHREDFALVPEWTIAVELLTDGGQDIEDLRSRWDPKPNDLPQIELLACLESPGPRLDPGTPEWRRARRMSRDQIVEEQRVLTVFADPPVTVVAIASGLVLAAIDVPDPIDELKIKIPRSLLTGLQCDVALRTVDAQTGVGIAMVKLVLLPAHGGGVRGSDPTGSDGTGRMTRVPSGRATLFLSSEAYATKLIPLQLEPGITNDLGTIELHRGISVRGRFVAPDGNGIACEADGGPYDETGSFQPITGRIKIETAKDGTFAIDRVSPGRYVLLATSKSQAGEEPTWTSGPVLVDLREKVEWVEVPVRNPIPVEFVAPFQDAFVDVLRIERDVQLVCASTRDVPCSLKLVPGTYVAVVNRPRKDSRRVPFTMGAEPLTVDLGD